MPLAVGDNAITVGVAAPSGGGSTSYAITATRAPAAAGCAIVDRGSPTDGVTTITVVQPPAPCNAGAMWSGWHCTVLRSGANNNGISYVVEARWNRVGQPVSGSFTWLTGNASNTFFRDGQNLSPWVQDQLDTVDQVRTIDLALHGNGTMTFPRNGYVNISAVYADVLEHLVAAGIATGVIGHFGSSGGSLMGAAALANHGLDRVLDGVVFGGGPFWIDLEEVCTDASSALFQSQAGRRMVDDWTWREVDGSTPCELRLLAPSVPYGCRSLLGTAANTYFPGTVVTVMVGVNDPSNPWIDASAYEFFTRITAQSKTFDRPNAPHNVLKTQAGADLVLQRIREIVAAGAS
jgi:hypothetical protein